MSFRAPQRRRTYVVGLGANLGQPLANLQIAADRLANLPDTELCARSAVYRSAAHGPPQPDFLNAAVKLRSACDPAVLLQQLHVIEVNLGRVRLTHWGPRTLDLDILWADRAYSAPGLQIPHPRLTERWWAMCPLLDVAPELESEYGQALVVLGADPVPFGTL